MPPTLPRALRRYPQARLAGCVGQFAVAELALDADFDGAFDYATLRIDYGRELRLQRGWYSDDCKRRCRVRCHRIR